jgi:hypothetical protein
MSPGEIIDVGDGTFAAVMYGGGWNDFKGGLESREEAAAAIAAFDQFVEDNLTVEDEGDTEE